MNNSVQEIAEKLLSFDKITIIAHIRPDGDTLGCAFALKHALVLAGKSANVVCESKVTGRYLFLTEGKSDISDDCTGGIVCVDVASPDMAGKKYMEFAEKADIVIDHHATNKGFGRYNIVNPDAAASGEIVFDIISCFMKPDKYIAECLYTALSTDTGCFVFANTTANTHLCASKLIETGIDVAMLNKKLFRTKSVSAFEIERRALDTLEYFYDKTVTCMVITSENIRVLGASDDDTEGLPSVPAQIDGVKAAVTFKQTGTDTYKVSVRTNGEIDAGRVCSAYGGGGHKMAAGCSMHGDYDTLKKQIAESLHDDERRNNITE